MLAERGRVHFVGVGGAGMSAIAKVLLERGVHISGSDLKRSRALSVLEALGARVSIGHDAELVQGSDVVVVSSAIPPHNPEVRRARELGIAVVSRGEALAALLDGSQSIVVAGTHGKTTTTSMIASVLRCAGLDPTYLIGGGLNDAGTNARHGRGEFVVAESDESDGSFLLLAPHVAVVTNVDADHLDHWSSLGAIREAFARWLDAVPATGTIVLPAFDGDLVAHVRGRGRRPTVFGDGGDVVAAVSRVLRVHRPGHWLDPGPFGCLGVGPPYALGVKAAQPRKPVVVVAGDGAFGLNGFEFETLTRFGLAAVFVIGNDAAWGEIRIPQIGLYGPDAEIATRLAPTPYHRLCDVFGGHAEHVERPAELAPALERALGAGEPAIVNVMLDPDAMAGHPYRGM
jgi:hypothetical protein